jgi:hypothetical protein
MVAAAVTLAQAPLPIFSPTVMKAARGCGSRAARYPAFTSVPIPKFVSICGTLGTNFGIERTLANL